MRNTGSFGLVLVLLVFLALFSAAFVVTEGQTVIVTQFGQFVRTASTAGLYWKIPFVQTVRYFDRRILEWDGEANQMPTKDKKFIWVDATARWRITDPLIFYQRLKNEVYAQSRLDDILDNATRDIVTGMVQFETVRMSNRPMQFLDEAILPEEARQPIKLGRNQITRLILERAREGVKDFGIEIVDLQIKRINYNQDVQASVYQRMISERTRIAKRTRSEGEGERQKILGKMEQELKRISSEGYRQAIEIRGRADALATKIYAESYSQDPPFYEFLRSLETYRRTMDDKTTLILTTDNKYLKYLKGKN
ncbi:protease modulator HflC [bacterium]|nr:protease modulator HflC [bacterium]